MPLPADQGVTVRVRVSGLQGVALDVVVAPRPVDRAAARAEVGPPGADAALLVAGRRLGSGLRGGRLGVWLRPWLSVTVQVVAP